MTKIYLSSPFLKGLHTRGKTIALALMFSVSAEAVFEKVPGIDSPRIMQVAVSEQNPSFIVAASDNSVYMSYDGGAHFIKSAVFKDEHVNHLFFLPGIEDTVLIACSRNGYKVGLSTERIYSAREDEVLHFIVQHHGVLYAGTTGGLYHSADSLLNWQPVSGLRNHAVYSLETAGSDMYLACDNGVFLYRPDEKLKRLFVTSGNGSSDTLIPRQIKVDAMDSSRLWLCTSRGVYVSNDRGQTWKKFFISGTGNGAASCISQFPLDGNHIYLCTDTGFFKVDTRTGESLALFEGLATTDTHWVDLAPSGAIYLATGKGLYKQETESSPPQVSQGSLAGIMRNEPSIQAVQEAAMRYNSVHPNKTGSWRKRLKYRALLPRFSVDYDKTIGSSFTSSGYYYAEGPNDWGVSLTWDMADLIWNSYEDDVDNRAKLTTQLRMDILDEVNRLYFERLRLKHEIMNGRLPYEDTVLKELRLDELTATLDGYTGGLYSRLAERLQL